MANENLPKIAPSTYKLMTASDLYITNQTIEQTADYAVVGSSSTQAAFFATTHTSTAGYNFITLLKKYDIGSSPSYTAVIDSVTTNAIRRTPEYIYNSLTGDNGVFLYTIPKDRYDYGIKTGSFFLSGSVDANNHFEMRSGSSASLYGEHVDVYTDLQITIGGNLLDNNGITGFLFNKEGVFGVVSTSANDGGGLTPLSGLSTLFTTLTSGNMQFTSQTVKNRMHMACKVDPNELNFSLNPSAFETLTSSNGYPYLYKLPSTLTAVEGTVQTYGDTDTMLGSIGDESITGLDSSALPEYFSFQPYVTTVGLYDDDNDLLAIAKLGKPIKKSTKIPMTFRIEIDI